MIWQFSFAVFVGCLLIFSYNPTNTIEPAAYFEEVDGTIASDIDSSDMDDSVLDSVVGGDEVSGDNESASTDSGFELQNPSPIRIIHNAKVTAYCLRGLTRSGTYTTYGTVATDRRYIPQLSRMMIEGFGDRIFTSLDTGSGVIGWHVDVWFDNCPAAIQWGTRYVDVWIIE